MKKFFVILFLFLLFLQTGMVSKASATHESMPFKGMNPPFNHPLRDEFDLKYDICNQLFTTEIKELLFKVKSLENDYYIQELNGLKMNVVDYQKQMKLHHFDSEFRKEYIMKHAKITEQVYNEKFITPLQKVAKPTISDSMTLKEIRETYKTYLQSRIDQLQKLIRN